jgi:hypothetical protein
MPGSTPIVGDVLEIRTLCFSIDQISVNVMHWRVGNVSGAGVSLQDIAAQFDTDVNGAYKNWMPANCNYRGIGITNLTGERTVEYHATGFTGPGTQTAKMLPTQTTGLISFKTALAGRHMRGRIFPGLPWTDWMLATSQMTAAGLIALNTIRSAIGLAKVASIGANSTTVVLTVMHRPTLARPIPPNSLTTDVTSAVASGLWATQRRRGEFGRTNQVPF